MLKEVFYLKLVRIILCQDEIIQLQQAIESPLYSVTPIVKKLYYILYDAYPIRDISDINKESLFAELHPGIPYKDLKMRRYFSSLTKIIGQFLTFKKLKEGTWQRKKILAEVYEDMGLYTYANQKRDEAHAFMDKNELKGEEYWLKKVELYDAEIMSLFREERNGVKTASVCEKLDNAVDHYFLFSKMRQGLLVKNYAIVFKSELKLRFLETVKQEYRAGFLQNDDLFNIFFLGLQLVEERSDEVFFAFESLFFHLKDELKATDKLLLFSIGINYANRQCNKGKTAFYIISFNWYKAAVEDDFIVINNSMSHVSFFNIVNFGAQAGEFDWVTEFMKSHIVYLPADIREEKWRLAELKLDYFRGDYDAVIQKISTNKFRYEYSCQIKSLQVRTYTMLFIKDKNYLSVLVSKIQSFENFLHRDKIWNNAIKVPYFNYCRILRRLISRLGNVYTTEENKIWFEKQVEKYPNTILQSWMQGLV